MVQKKRHFIHGKSMVEVIYRKSGKPSRGLNGTSNSADESIPPLDPVDHENARSRKKDEKPGLEFTT